MKALLLRLALACVALLALPGAHAAITCTSITSPGVSMGFVNNTTTNVQTYFTVSCTRGSTTDPTSVTYNVRVDDGNNANGVNNRARMFLFTLRYDLYTNAACSNGWKGNTNVTDTITWPVGSTGTITKQTYFWGCVTNSQTAIASGTYTDSIDMTLTYGNNITLTGTIAVRLFAPALCTLTTPPPNLVLPYAAFGPAVVRTVNFAVRCTDGMPYTLATDATEGVLTGLRYTLALSAPSGTGTGAPQSYGITARISAGQAGQCGTGACTGTRAHTLTISY
jgi:spore coat protein U-like protein